MPAPETLLTSYAAGFGLICLAYFVWCLCRDYG